jgi:hypothetical protein
MEIAEWRAYFKVKERYTKEKTDENAEKAKERVKKDNY